MKKQLSYLETIKMIDEIKKKFWKPVRKKIRTY